MHASGIVALPPFVLRLVAARDRMVDFISGRVGDLSNKGFGDGADHLEGIRRFAVKILAVYTRRL
jgi:hypothetical protein